MKKTYKLLSIFLDGISFPAILNVRYEENIKEKPIFAVGFDYSLFDKEIYRREIKISTVLSFKTLPELLAFFSTNKTADEILIHFDIKVISVVVHRFLIKRTLQLFALLEENFPKVNFILGIQKEEYKPFESMLFSKILIKHIQ